MSENMKKLNLLEEFYFTLNRVMEYLNKYVFDNEFSNIVFLIHGERATMKNTLGVTCLERWQIEDQIYNEISLTAEWLQCENQQSMLTTLVHEYIHHKGSILGINTTDKTGRRHNRKFKELGEQYGLIFTEPDKNRGWTNHVPNENLKKIFNNCIKECGLDKFNKKIIRLKPEIDKIPKKFFKYVCVVCNKSIKAPLDSNIICGDDGVEFEFRDKLPLIPE